MAAAEKKDKKHKGNNKSNAKDLDKDEKNEKDGYEATSGVICCDESRDEDSVRREQRRCKGE